MMTMSYSSESVEKRYSAKRGSLPYSLKEVGFYFSKFSYWDGYMKE